MTLKAFAARASVPDHRVQPEESCTDCNSSIQEEIKALLTNRIIPEVETFLCTGCRVTLSFTGDALQQCHTASRTSLSMMIAVARPAVRSPVSRGRNITVYLTDSDEEKKAWLTQLLYSLITLLQGYTDPKLGTFSTFSH